MSYLLRIYVDAPQTNGEYPKGYDRNNSKRRWWKAHDKIRFSKNKIYSCSEYYKGKASYYIVRKAKPTFADTS